MGKPEKDILKLIPPPKTPPKLTARRIGIHTSSSGGVQNAAERAYRLATDDLQVVEPLGAATLLTVDVDGQVLKVQTPPTVRSEPHHDVWLRVQPNSFSRAGT